MANFVSNRTKLEKKMKIEIKMSLTNKKYKVKYDRTPRNNEYKRWRHSLHTEVFNWMVKYTNFISNSHVLLKVRTVE